MGAAALPALMMAGTAVSAIGQYQSNKQAQAAAEYNAKVYEAQAAQIETSKELESKRRDKQKERFKGSQVAAASKAGAGLGQTTLDLIADSMYEFELDGIITDYNYEMEKSGAMARSQMARMEASNYGSQSILQPVGTLLTGGSQAYLKYGGVKGGKT